MSKIYKSVSLIFLLTATSWSIPLFRRSWQTKPPVGSVLDYSKSITKGLIGCWLFNEGAGRTYTDLTKNSVPFTFTGSATTTWANGIRGQGVGLGGDGNNSGNPTLIVTPTIAYTFFEVIDSQSGAGNQTPINQETSSPRSWLIRWDSTTSITHYVFNTGVSATACSATITAAQMNQGFALAGSYDTSSNNITIYVNGILANTCALSGTFQAPDNNLRIGKGSPAGQEWSGNIYLTYFWNRALSANEIRDLSVNPYSFIAPRPLNHWWQTPQEIQPYSLRIL